MQRAWKPCLVLSGCAALAGALLHIAIVFGGPSWFGFFGAPAGIVRMAAAGHWYPTFLCLAIATILLFFAAYAFSGAGLLRRLPLLPFVLALVGCVLCLRGLAFIPLVLLAPTFMAGITSSTRVDSFLVLTSLLCLAMGLAYLKACSHIRRHTGRTR